MTRATRLIKEKARQAGFQKVGICPAQNPSKLALLAGWLDRGNHGTMLWMQRSRDKRQDVFKLFSGVRSIIVLGMNYFAPLLPASGAIGISRYAHGRDYHETIEERSQSLAEEIRTLLPGSEVLTYCDTGPILEKVWAEAAGVGWQGKHSNLLTKDFSSWVFLAVLLTDAVLEYDLPAANHCGTCTLCIRACPTQAITEAYVVDSRRCISYLTIEYRGITPRELRPGIGKWIFGCDICQEVCPWNRFSRPTTESDFQPSNEVMSADPLHWLTVSQEEFDQQFAGSPIRRAGWSGFLRNLVIALGNARNPSYGPQLAAALNHNEALVRGHAAWALGCCPWRGAAEALQHRLCLETDSQVREEIAAALH